MCTTQSRRFGGSADTPGQARAFCEQLLGSLFSVSQAAEELVGRMSIVMSELTTNAVVAGSRLIDVQIDVHRRHIVVSVSDDAGGHAVAQSAGPQDDHGRGLQMVARVASSWGVDYTAQGKKVWANVMLPQELRPAQ